MNEGSVRRKNKDKACCIETLRPKIYSYFKDHGNENKKQKKGTKQCEITKTLKITNIL